MSNFQRIVGVLASCACLLSTGIVSAQPDSAESTLLEPSSGAWLVAEGDDLGWSQPSFDDSDWSKLTGADDLRQLAPRLWLRGVFDVPSSWRGRSVTVRSELRGSLQLYLDGRLALNLGGLSTPERSPLGFGRRFASLSFPNRETVHLAVRYEGLPHRGFDWHRSMAGFRLKVGSADALEHELRDRVRTVSRHQWFFAGLFLGQGLLHALLFCFWPTIRSNLRFSVVAVLVATLVLLQFERFVDDSPQRLEWTYRLAGPVLLATMVALLAFFYEVFDRPRRAPFWGLVLGGVALTAYSLAIPQTDAFLDFGLFHLLVLADIGWGTFGAFRQGWPGSWTLGVGLIVLAAGLASQLALMLGWLPSPWEFFPVGYWGAAGLFVSASVYLAFHISRLARNLREQLAQVEELSQKTLEQELKARESELEQRALARENERKGLELEEARALQMSMLPHELPQLDGFEIAAHMVPATEVAGDFYDARLSPAGLLTLAIADVTGHGARAGAMVSLVKGMIAAFTDTKDARIFLRESSRALRDLRLPGVHVAMGIVRLRGNVLSYTSAGMPPAYILRRDDQRVEELLLPSLPLGAIVQDKGYLTRITELSEGDTLLLLSDGFPELLNADGDALGYGRVQRCLAECVGKSARQVIEHFDRVASSWVDDGPYPDDLTFLVLQKLGRDVTEAGIAS
ncbi:MAG: SpoIIE family protein phosphatase [Acidobacteriota bacterium]